MTPPAGPSAAAAANDAPPAKPKVVGLSMEALEKAKKVLQLQAKLKEKLKTMPQKLPPASSTAAGGAGGDMVSKAAAVAASFGQPAPAAGSGSGSGRLGGSRWAPQQPAPGAGAIAPGMAAATAAAAGTPSGFRPAPLRLDALGREVDEKGNVVARPVQVVTSLKVNQPMTAAERKAKDAAAAAAAAASAPAELSLSFNDHPELDPGFDPRMASKKAERRRKSTFDFVQEGSFQKQAEMMRLKAKFGDAAMRRLPLGPIGPQDRTVNPNLLPLGGAPPGGGGGGGDPNLVPIGTRRAALPDAEQEAAVAAPSTPLEPPPPAVEWWDKNLLATGSYEADVQDDKVAIKPNKLTIYVEHPIPIEPPSEAPPPPPQPLKLTKKELKKLRTQRRQAREKEKQDLIRQGLLEPPKPKVKIANLYRVLGEQAVADPTAMEKEVRKQMAERQAAHEDRNLSRMLTPAEKREKKLKKMFEEENGVKDSENVVTAYKITRLENKQSRFKIDINAKENHMTGVMLVSAPFSLVVVEGGRKASKRYMKLMLRRIDWADQGEEEEEGGGDDGEGGEDMDEQGGGARKEPGSCDMVWQGMMQSKAFKRFTAEIQPEPSLAKAFLDSHQLGHLWDVAAAFNRDEAPPVSLD